MTTAFVPKESAAGETRVAASPETVKQFAKAGVKVAVESGAGERASFTDAAYQAAGATIGAAWDADIVLKVQPPSKAEIAKLRAGARVVSFVTPSANPELVRSLADAKSTSFAMDLVPRITRAQSMDALSSQATVAGYKAVLLAAANSPRMCPLLMTAAGTVPPAKVVIFGAGVAGLMAIGIARRLGCTIEATDVRRAAKEQVESLGARFIDVPGAADMEGSGGYAKEQSEEFLKRQREEVAKRVADADIVITTAQVPGKKAPRLVSEEMVRSMKQGAVIVDLAVESGGNCALSVPGEIAVRHGVTIIGIANLPATVPLQASELYARNVLALVRLMLEKDGALKADLSDEVLAGCLLTHAGEIKHAATVAALAAPSAR
ncbi:MAG: Re/Si-specific NAD(P)(+) transhydrogenase subunit alpha [Planctomycetota bacterium]|nr:MAG: Re/Si-specific NAD(P)(+) transhydrogenase subunit alpha [Planctomycetota bacterium]